MPQDNDVATHLDELAHPFRPEVDRLREIIKEVDSEIREEWKWRAPSYSYRGETLVTFNLWEKNRIHLVFHNPKIPEIQSDLLQGDYPSRRMAYFSGMSEVEEKRPELTRILTELLARTGGGMSSASQTNESESDFPDIGKPARAALELEGYTRLDQLVTVRDKDLLKLHGVGPKAIRILREALAARGQSFAE